MHCETIQDKLIGLMDGDLRTTERLGVEVHLTRCYICQEELEALRTEMAHFNAQLHHPAPMDRFEELQAAIARERVPRRTFSPLPSWDPARRVKRFAVCVGLAVLAAVVWPFGLSGSAWPIKPGIASGSMRSPVTRSLLERQRAIRDELDLPRGAGVSAARDDGPPAPADRHGTL